MTSAEARPLGLLGLLFAVPAFLAPVISFFAPRAVAPMVVLAALVVVGMAIHHRRWPTALGGPLVTILVLLCAWALASVLWAPDSWLAIRGTMKLAGNLLAGVLLFGMAARLGEQDAGIVQTALIAGFAVAFSMLAIEVLFGAPISAWVWGELPAIQWYGHYWLNSCASILALLVWPLALVLWRRVHVFATVLTLAATIVLIAAMGYSTAAAALIIGAVFAIVGFAFRGRAGTIFAAGFVAIVLVMPLLPGTLLKPDVIADAPTAVRTTLSHRLYIWAFTAERIAEHPLRGWGMNASRVIPGGKDRAIDPQRGDVGENLPLHPHNMMLQVWLELGLPGILLICALGAIIIVRLGGNGQGGAKKHRDAVAIHMGQMGTILTISSASFGTWSSWWLCAIWLAASLTAVLTATTTKKTTGKTAAREAPA